MSERKWDPQQRIVHEAFDANVTGPIVGNKKDSRIRKNRRVSEHNPLLSEPTIEASTRLRPTEDAAISNIENTSPEE